MEKSSIASILELNWGVQSSFEIPAKLRIFHRGQYSSPGAKIDEFFLKISPSVRPLGMYTYYAE